MVMFIAQRGTLHGKGLIARRGCEHSLYAGGLIARRMRVLKTHMPQFPVQDVDLLDGFDLSIGVE